MNKRRLNRPSGFTLLEMVVVLVLLAAVATIAVQSIDGRLDQSRYEATQAAMQNIQDAVVGPLNQRSPDGTISVSGFVADMGRLPQVLPVFQADGITVVTNTITQNNGTSVTKNVVGPVELWSNPNNLAPFSLRHAWNSDNVEVGLADQDIDVYVPCGWRGPYLRLSVGQTDPRDAWGNPFDCLLQTRLFCNGTLNDVNNQISILRSNGANGSQDNAVVTGYDPDLYINFNTNKFNGVTTVANDYPAVSASNTIIGSIHGKISGVDTATSTIIDPLTANGKIFVRYFGPRPSGTGALVITVPYSTQVGVPNPSNANQLVYTTTIEGVTLSVTIDTATNASATPSTTIATYDVTNATVGPRQVRAYQNATLPVAGSISPVATTKTTPTTVVITPGGLQKDLILR